MLTRITPLPMVLEILATRAKTLPTISVIAVRVGYTALKWSERARSRRALKNLTDDQLWDIGIPKYAARKEGRKPFWRQ